MASSCGEFFCLLQTVGRILGYANRTSLLVTRIDQEPFDALPFHQRYERRKLHIIHWTARKERSHVFWERFTLGVQHIVNKGHWPEWPKDQEWSGIFLRSAAESFTPVARRSSVSNS